MSDNNPRDPKESGLEAGLQAGFGPASPSEAAPSSALFALKQLVGAKCNVLLREEQEEAAVAPLRSVPEDLRAALPQSGRNYQILGELARGGMGVVLKGHDGDLGRDVALKVLHRELARKAEPVQRFIEEAQIGGQLQHPGIVPIYEVGLMEGERPYFAMKLVKGKTLAAQLAGRESTASERRRFLLVFEQACLAVAYAHSRGVIHRDLKPSNVMVGAFGEVQVLDWGLAKVLASGGIADEERAAAGHMQKWDIETIRSGSSDGSHSRAGSVMGTPAYMAPEQARGETGRLDERCDVFALGAILCELLTGRPPFVGDRDQTLRLAAAATLDDAFARLSACDAESELVDLARHCMAANPEARPRNAGVVARIVQEHLAQAEERAHRSELAAVRAQARAVAERRAQRLTLALGATVVVALLGGTAGYVAYDHHERTRRSRNADSARAALKDAAFERGQGAPDAALAAVRRAEIVAAREEIDVALQGEIASLRGALESEIAALAATREREDRERTLLAALERASIEDTDLQTRPLSSGSPSPRDAAYEEAFRRFGLDFGTRDDEEIVAALRSTRNAVAIAAFLDQWALVNRPPDAAGEARRLLRFAARVDPDSDRCRLREAALAGNRGELLKLAAAAHDDPPPPLTSFVLGLFLEGSGGAADAIEVVRQAVHDHPGDFRLRCELAHLLAHATPTRSQEALPHAEAAVALEPASISAALIRIDVLRRLGRLQDALAEAKDLARRDPDSYLPWVTLARLHGESGEIDESKRCARTAIGLDPLRPSPHYVLARGLACDEGEEPALRECQEAARLSERYLPELGEMLHRFGRYDEAIEAFRKAVRVDPIWAYRGLYDAYAAKGDIGRATDAIRRALDAAADAPPRDRATLLFELGRALGKGGDTGAAIERWRESLSLDPDQPDRLEWLAFKLFYSRRFDEAIDDFRRLNPTDAFSCLRRELQQVQTGARNRDDIAELHETAVGLAALAIRGIVVPAEAVAAFEDVLARDPKHVDSHVELARLLTFDPNSDIFDPETALDLVDDALDRAPDQPAARHMKGVVLHRLGRHEESVAALRDAIAEASGAPGRVEDWLFLAMAYHELGDRPQSMECFQRIGRDPRPETSLDPAVVSRIESEARAILGLEDQTGSNR